MDDSPVSQESNGYCEPGDIDRTDEEYWQQYVEAARQGDSNASRYLIHDLVLDLRGQAKLFRGVNQSPAVRNCIADFLDAALEASAAGVSDALGITRPAKRRRRGMPEYRRAFIQWYCQTLDDNGLPSDHKLKRAEREAWLNAQSKEVRGIDDRTLLRWAAEARAEHADPKSHYHLDKLFDEIEDIE